MRPRFRVTLSLAVSLGIASAAFSQVGSAPGQRPPAGEEPAAPLRFRRVYVPLDGIKDWPRASVRHVPMDKWEFERLVDAAAAPADSPAGSAGQALASAQYTARLLADGMLDGEAVFDLKRLADAPALVSLEPCGLAIGAAVWAAETRRPAKLGLTPDGKLAALIEGSGRLECNWSLRGRRDSLGSLDFALELPACPASRLTLDLPQRVVPLSDRGVVLQDPAEDAGFARWRVELGGNHRLNLRLVPSEDLDPNRKPNALREARTYEFSPRGIDVSVQWTLDVPNVPLRQIALTLDPGLQLTAVRYGDAAVKWSVTSAAADGGKPRVVLDLPEPIRGSSRVVRLAAMAPLELGRRGRLPSIRAEGFFWQEATATLLVPAPLVLEHLAVIDGRQTGTGSLPAPRAGQSAEAQLFSPDGGVEVVVVRPEASVSADTGTSVVLGGVEMTARTVTSLRAVEGERFELEADVARAWTVDSVETVPADALGDWSLQEEPTGPTRLTVRLAKPVTRFRPIRVLVTGRYLRSPLGRMLSAHDLAPLRFRDVSQGKRLVAVRAAESYQLKWSGAEPPARIDPQGLTSAESDLFLEPPTGFLLANPPGADTLQLSLEPQKPSYSATIRVEATAFDQGLAESYRIACVPETGRVERLLVQFSPPRGGPLRWVLAGEEEEPIAVRPWPPTGRPAPGGPQTQIWEITFSRPKSVPFELRAARTSPLAEATPISLACVPEAGSQRGTVLVGVSSSRAIHIENHRLTRIPAEPVPIAQYASIRAAYRYEPLREAAAGGEAAIVFSPESSPAGPPMAWVWSCRLQSRYEATGQGRHLAVYSLQNTGRPQMELSLPPPLTVDHVQGIWVDGSRTARQSVAGSEKRLRVSLPSGKKFPVVSVAFATHGPPLGTIGSLEPALPDPDVPTLARTWVVWLPSGYDCPELRSPRHTGVPLPQTVAQRLFGPLGSSAGSGPGLLPPGAWTETPPESRAPWASLDWVGSGSIDNPQWAVCHLEWSGAEPRRIRLVHRGTMDGLGYAAFLAVFALAVWKMARRPASWTVVAGAAATATLLLPEVYAPVATGTFLAVLAALLFRACRPRREPTATRSDSSASTAPCVAIAGSVRAGILMLATMATCLGHTPAQAEQPATEPAAGAPLVHSILIPVDDKEKPAGDKYYVPEAFFGQLQRLAAARADQPQSWMIRAATYRGTLSRQASPEQLLLGELKATFELQVFERQVRVRLPLGGEGVELAPQGALLDGRVIVPEWSSRDGLEFDIAEAGQYRLELSLRSPLEGSGLPTAFEMKIPRLATSRLELSVPRDAPEVDVPAALGTVVRQGDPPRLVAHLGPTDRLTIRWNEGMEGSFPGPSTDVEELVWLRVQPGSVVLDTLLRVKVVEGPVRRLDLATDPRLRLLPLDTGRPPVARVEIIPGQPQVIRFHLAPPVTDQCVIAASFLLTERSGIGNLRLPYTNVSGGRTTRRWLAVSIDPRLQYRQQSGDGLQTLAVPQFLAAWGGAKGQPVLACVLPSPRPDWSISTRPVASRTTVQQNLAFCFGPTGARVRLEAELEIASGTCFQHRIAAPPELEIEELSVREQGAERIARWRRDPDGTVSVFLAAAATGKQTLLLCGRLPTPGQGTIPLPPVRVEGEEMKPGIVQLFREPGVLVRMGKSTGLVEVQGPVAEESKASLGRPVKCFEVGDRGRTNAAVILTPNRPKVLAEQVTALAATGATWTAEADFRLKVRGGLVDELRLEIPLSWRGPFEVHPSIPLKVVETSGKDRQMGIIRPPTAIEGEYRFRISSPVAYSPGERLSTVKIAMDQVELAQHLLVLPVEKDLRPLAWETQGLVGTSLPEQLSVPPAARSSLVAYQVVREPFVAVLESPDRPSGVPRVLLAEVNVAWQPEGDYRGVAAFDLEPAGMATCNLRLPADCRLIAATAAGLPTTPRATGPGTWQVPLGPATLPQRVEVVYAGKSAGAAGVAPRVFLAPTLDGLPVRQTLWSISGPRGYEVASNPAGEAVSRLQQKLVRLRSTTEMIERALEIALYEPEEMARWYRPLARRWSTSHDELKRLLTPVQEDEVAQAVWLELESLERRQALMVERLGAGEILTQAAAEASVSDDPIELWLWTLEQPQSVVRFVSDQAGDAITLVYRKPTDGEQAWRLVAAAGLALATAVLVWAVRRGIAAPVLRQWLPLWGIAAGVAWWLWLTPSILGLVLMLVAFGGGLRRLGHRRRESSRPALPIGGAG